MWNTLQPAIGGRLYYEEWGALYQAQHIVSRGQKEVWLRVAAGCSRYTTVYATRHGSYQQSRSPHTDAQKLAVLQCPCGMGVQDSMHVLLCAHHTLVGFRRQTLTVSEACVQHLPARGGCKRHKANNDTATRRAQQPRQGHLSRTEKRCRGNTDGWMVTTDVQRMLASLGSHCIGLPKRVHLHVISMAATHCGDVEKAYAGINGFTL